jgi:hypothetical protein
VDFLLISRGDQRTKPAARLLLAALIAAASPAAYAHDGGVIGLVIMTAVVGLILGVIGGAQSGWYARPLLVCLGGTLAASGAAILIIELTTDNAIIQNFWPNMAVLASCAGVPLAIGYPAAHLIGAGNRKARKAGEGDSNRGR